ncbi:hypothetical protein QGN29_01740 [Temperatibacter marinus]|uniref:Uncharacterized protein n=1 Tax=Temperatibacter marinus TaxID=1456591 RepID=A0AA52EJB6_9PROT|nr:hypothetical protein [Temperatibacter marinus]WND03086.1 hypothetical protein QGN29_01740 [Temperatibacter marinus]
MKVFLSLLLGLSLISPTLTAAEETIISDAMVEGSTKLSSRRHVYIPAINLQKRADFMVLGVTIINDSRQKERREDEIYSTIEHMMERAQKSDHFSLGTGERIFQPLTTENFKLDLLPVPNKDDMSQVRLLVKAPLAGSVSANALAQSMKDFIRAARGVGRSDIVEQDRISLTVINPERYRMELIGKIAAHTSETARQFSEHYELSVHGLSNALKWKRRGLDMLTLYLPYNYTLKAISK